MFPTVLKNFNFSNAVDSCINTYSIYDKNRLEGENQVSMTVFITASSYNYFLQCPRKNKRRCNFRSKRFG